VSRKREPGQKLITKTGTVQFSAPEIFSQSEYDEKIDVWSAGVILYMMLSGT
jgi:calcium-dependent protein kinase